MFLPFGDYPNPPGIPWITRILLGLNVAVFLLVTLPMSRQPIRFDELDLNDANTARALRNLAENSTRSIADLENHPQISRAALLNHMYGYTPGQFSWLTLLSCMFLHGGFMHLAGNMLFLWIYGNNVEARLGVFGYLLGYLVTGALATLSFAWASGSSTQPLVGASGAISGVLGFYLVWFPHNRIKVFMWFFYVVQILHLRAGLVLMIYLVINNVVPALVGAGGNVAYLAHIGGFAAGAGFAFLIDLLFGRKSVAVPELHGRRTYRRDPREPISVRVLEDPARIFTDAVRDERMADAAHAFARLHREGGAPPSPVAVFQLAEWLYQGGFVRDAVTVFRYYIRNFPKGTDLDRAHLGLGILLARALGQLEAAREHFLTAIDVADDAATEATAREELKRLGG